MPRKVGNFSERQMKNAVLDVVQHGSSIRAAAKNAGLCHMTLKRYVEKYKSAENKDDVKFIPNYEVNKVFSKELEDQLEEYLLTASKMHHGLTRLESLRLAYELAVS